VTRKICELIVHRDKKQLKIKESKLANTNEKNPKLTSKIKETLKLERKTKESPKLKIKLNENSKLPIKLKAIPKLETKLNENPKFPIKLKEIPKLKTELKKNLKSANKCQCGAHTCRTLTPKNALVFANKPRNKIGSLYIARFQCKTSYLL
jgi:hypothetical protein